jgi:hypothetical protein
MPECEIAEHDVPSYGRSVFDADYWLSRAEGFAVESPSAGRVGVVESLRFYSRHDRPDELVVRVGRLGRRLIAIAADDVDSVLPREKRLILKTSAVIARATR